MRAYYFASAVGLAVVVAAPASADPVCEWVEFAQGIGTAATPPPGPPRTPDHDRAQTQVALAIFEATDVALKKTKTAPLFGTN